MRRLGTVFAICFVLLAWHTTSFAAPMDLSTFAVWPGGVTESGGEVTFEEDTAFGALYFYDDLFFVEEDDTVLSFDYTFSLGPDDYWDYFTFSINYIQVFEVDTISAGNFAIDLTDYQNDTISLEWALLWGGDWEAGAVATISNIDLASSSDGAAPVPEPGTLVLTATGLAGFWGARRRLFRCNSTG
jgi:hypothetical protein